jgi:hypothetical protein
MLAAQLNLNPSQKGGRKREHRPTSGWGRKWQSHARQRCFGSIDSSWLAHAFIGQSNGFGMSSIANERWGELRSVDESEKV